ncbi:MAG: hypothetical protein GY940_27665, partial [bacterium]|nr:hypothetical protein [bacterium]
LLLVVVLNTLPAFFYHPEENNNQLQPFYKKGVYHVHSLYSDGKGRVDEIAKAAETVGLDFVILTDHGRPNIKSVESTGWFNNVLMIGASELSLNCGHLAAAGFKEPGYIYPPEPQETINEIVRDNKNGVCFVSHPFDSRITWTDWDIDGFTGLEVFSSYTEARRAGIFKALQFPFKYLIDSKYALLNTMKYPTDNLKKWDALNRNANKRIQFFGIYAVDAHAKIKIFKGFQLNFPTYESMFEIMTVYVRTGGEFDRGKDAETAMDSVTAALRAGRFFNVMEAIAPANGFDAFFVEEESKKRVLMGGVSEEKKGTIVVTLPFEFETVVRVIKDGMEYEQITNNTIRSLEIRVKEPGVYRLELFARGNTFDDLPWILTNPFFVGLPPPPLDDSMLKKEAYVIANRKPLAMKGEELTFKVEKNRASEASLSRGATGFKFTFKLAKDEPGSEDFWAVMALRRGFDLSGAKGFAMEVKSTTLLRYWLEFRTKNGEEEEEIWFRHSFRAEPEWSRVRIPFETFHAYNDNGKKGKPDMSAVQAIFIGINNAVAYEGTEGELIVKDLSVF